MNRLPIIFETSLNAPLDRVWQAITDKEHMKKWYFQFEEFNPEPGFKFQFVSGPENGTQYLHVCEIKEVVPQQKISYSWRYDGYTGDSLVTFELLSNGPLTTIQLKHEGLDTFPEDVADFARANFEGGWTYLIGTGLKDYLEK